jgi:LDH2 family malate/lactate/ureidoglycolate dehydrogenase
VTSCTVGAGELERWAREALVAAGAAEDAAEVTAQCLVDANLRGLDTHGVLILRLYLPRLASGAIDGHARPRVVNDHAAAALVDGCNALGPYTAAFAVDLCCEKARAAGAACVAVRGSNHFSAASCYAERAAAQGCVAIVCSNSDPGMAPPGALRPVLGTNPIAIAAPGPVDLGAPSLDMATSVVALGKVRVAALAGEAIPPGWALGPDGSETLDPSDALAGSLLPMAAHKGFALAFMLDVLAGCVPNANVSPQIPGSPDDPDPQGTGHLVFALDLRAFASPDAYEQRLRTLVDAVRAADRAPGTDPCLIPGEREAAIRRERDGHIPVPAGELNLLRGLGERFGVPFPAAV